MSAPVRRLSAADPVRSTTAGWIGRFASAGPLLVAVSGGADSLALAAAVTAEAGADRATAVTVDHRLQAGSGEQAAHCADQLRQLGFANVLVAPVTVEAGGGVEAAARRARQRALIDIATQLGGGVACRVLLGHTLDDQAETVLLGLARGSGPRSIAGMRAWRAPWGRPLLGIRRSDTENACAAVGLTPWQDPHNTDRAFTRVRLRTQVLPLLERVLGGGVAPALARTADLLADDLAVLDDIAALVLPSITEGSALNCSRLAEQPAGLRRRIVRHWLAGQGLSGLTADHLYRVDDLLAAAGGAAVRLPGGRDVIRRQLDLVLTGVPG
jgi:tRNA(Ile)-lysidine synthase